MYTSLALVGMVVCPSLRVPDWHTESWQNKATQRKQATCTKPPAGQLRTASEHRACRCKTHLPQVECPVQERCVSACGRTHLVQFQLCTYSFHRVVWSRLNRELHCHSGSHGGTSATAPVPCSPPMRTRHSKPLPNVLTRPAMQAWKLHIEACRISSTRRPTVSRLRTACTSLPGQPRPWRQNHRYNHNKQRPPL